MKKFLLAAMMFLTGCLTAQTVHFPGKETNNVYTGTDQFTQGVLVGPVTFTNLPAAPANGTTIYCIDCLVSNPCAAGGTGSFANRVNGAWQCNQGSGGSNATQLQGTGISASAPTLNQALVYNGSVWAPTTISSAIVDSSIEIISHKDQANGYVALDGSRSAEIHGNLLIDGNLQIVSPWLVTTTWPGSPMSASAGSQSAFGVSNDGTFQISINGSTPSQILTVAALNSTTPFPQTNYNNIKFQNSSGSYSAEVHDGANAEQFVFTSSPAGTVSIGANTVTLTPVPCGVNGADTNHYVYIAGTGTPEVVKITGGTATSCGASGTITFTAVNSHSAGFTVQSATAGVAEAAKYVQAANIGGRVFTPPGSVNNFLGPLFITSNASRDTYNMTFDFTGSDITCSYTGGSCIQVGPAAGGNSNLDSHITIINPRMAPFAAIGSSANHYAAIEDNAQGTTIVNFRTRSRDSGGHFFRDLIINDNDQNLMLMTPHLTGDDAWGNCDTTFCSNFFYSPGGGGNSGITRVVGGDIALACNGNGFDDHNGNNSLSLINTVIQAYSQWALRVNSGTVSLVDVYNEAGGCTNPIYGTVTQAGYIVRGEVQSTGGSGPSSINPTFANNASGGTTYSYFLVMNNGSAKSNPLYIGRSAVNSGTVTSITVTWPGTDYFSGAITTFDLLRVSTLGTTPIGTANYAVTTALTTGTACTNRLCTFTDTNAALGSYTVVNNLSPALQYFPGGLVLTSSQDRTGATTDYGYYRGKGPGGDGWINNTLPVIGSGGGGNLSSGQNVFLDPSSAGSFNWTGPMPLFLNQNGGSFPQPTILTNGRTSGDANGLMGRLIFSGARIQNGDIVTLDDTAPAVTTTAQLRIAGRDADAAIGFDQTAGLVLRAGTSLSFYINHLPTSGDTTYKLRVDGSNITIKEPMTTNSQITSTLATGTPPLVPTSTTPVPNLNASPITYNAAGTQQVSPHITQGTCTLGTNCSVTLSGSAVFTNSSSYQCSVVDTTAIAAVKFAPTSGSAFTLTGTGTDVLSYICNGN